MTRMDQEGQRPIRVGITSGQMAFVFLIGFLIGVGLIGFLCSLVHPVHAQELTHQQRVDLISAQIQALQDQLAREQATAEAIEQAARQPAPWVWLQCADGKGKKVDCATHTDPSQISAVLEKFQDLLNRIQEVQNKVQEVRDAQSAQAAILRDIKAELDGLVVRQPDPTLPNSSAPTLRH